MLPPSIAFTGVSRRVMDNTTRGRTDMITIYHLDRSRSERPVWLMEELGAPYRIEHFDRMPTLEAEPAYKKLHPLGSSPVISDDGKIIAESGAVIEYLANTQGGGRLAVKPGASSYADYLFWFHFAESSLMNEVTREIMSEAGGVAFDNMGRQYSRQRTAKFLSFVDERLGETTYFAGDDFTAADIMVVFVFTTTRLFTPVDLTPYPNLSKYMERIEARPAYQRSQAIAGPNRDRSLG
jgi:glutathione S-transferase